MQPMQPTNPYRPNAPSFPSFQYTHSGKAPITGVLLALGVGLGSALVLGFIYAYALAYIPVVGKITFVLAACFGAAVGYLGSASAGWGKVRNNKVSVGIGALSTLVGFYIAWAVWVYAVLNRGSVETSLTDLLFGPGQLWTSVWNINETGAWSLRGGPVNGTFLTVLWALEAAIIMGAGLIAAAGGMEDRVYCERCDTWCAVEPNVLQFSDTPTPALQQSLNNRDLRILTQSGPRSPVAPTFNTASLSACPKCGQTTTMSVHHVGVQHTDQGEQQQRTPVINDMYLTPEEARWVRQVGQQMAQQSFHTPQAPMGG